MKKSIYILILLVGLFGCEMTPPNNCSHEYAVTQTIPSTCHTPGKKVETCGLCGDVKETALSLTAHNFVETMVNATCSSEGYTLKVCSECGTEEKVNFVEKTSHTYSETMVSATCSSEGYTLKVCSECGTEEKVNFVEKTSHTYSETMVNATCSSEGYTLKVCSECGNEEKVDFVEKTPHDKITTVISPDCTNDGYTIFTCKNCDYNEEAEFVSATGHSFNDWVIITHPTEVSDGLRSRECSVCHYIEEEYIISNAYVDLSVIKEPFDSSQTYECDNYEALLLKFNAAILNMSEILSVKLQFTMDFNELLNQLVKDCAVPFSFQIGASLKGDELILTMEYKNIPTKKTDIVAYTQHQSLNYQPIATTRDASFEDFKINNSLYSFTVSTSDQLYYALERGVKPVCVEGSSAEMLYDKIKEVLRNIINDEMTDFEKVKAIHDYLVMNVTYDDALLKLLYAGNAELKSYNGFYLEGVFLDKKAVCEGISKSVTVMCNIEGIPCVSVEGYQTQNPNGAGHAWNKVYVDNEWYILDATSDGTIISSSFEVLTYAHFLVSETTYQMIYTGNTFKNIVCENTYDSYAKYHYTYLGETSDFKIESQSELDHIIGYFFNESNSLMTIEFLIAFDYGDSVVDEIQKACQNNLINAQFSYITSDASFMLVK